MAHGRYPAVTRRLPEFFRNDDDLELDRQRGARAGGAPGSRATRPRDAPVLRTYGWQQRCGILRSPEREQESMADAGHATAGQGAGKATGRCLCGAVRFEATGVSRDVHACHCGMCRRWSGGPGFGVQVEQVEFSGGEALGRYDSSEWAERGFCKRCGTSLFYRLKQPGVTILWQGAFDRQEGFALDGEIFVDEKPPGYDLAGEHARLTGAEFMASLGSAAAED